MPINMQKKIKNGITPPQLEGWCCDCLERLRIEGVGRIIGNLSIDRDADTSIGAKQLSRFHSGLP
jgi:hypothetical protein